MESAPTAIERFRLRVVLARFQLERARQESAPTAIERFRLRVVFARFPLELGATGVGPYGACAFLRLWRARLRSAPTAVERIFTLVTGAIAVGPYGGGAPFFCAGRDRSRPLRWLSAAANSPRRMRAAAEHAHYAHARRPRSFYSSSSSSNSSSSQKTPPPLVSIS